MSDYLGNLVARTLAPTASVRPQLLSVFEPPPANSGFKVPLDSNPETSTVSSRLAPGAQSPTPPHVYRESAHEGVSSTPQPSPSERVPGARDESTVVRPLHVFAPLGPTQAGAGRPAGLREDGGVESVHPRPSRRADEVGPTEPASEERAGALPLPPTILLRSRLTPQGTGQSLEPREDREVESVELGLPHRSDDVRTPEPVAAPLRPTISVERRAQPFSSPTLAVSSPSTEVGEDTPTPAAVRPLGIPRPAVDAGAPRHESVQSPAIRPVVPAPIFPPHVPPTVAVVPPTIHVTIGRVEVRATQPPAARPRPQAAGAPVMTLDEYLRQRASGGSR